MIQSISIKNFQSHKLTKLEFVKGVNGIVGLSQSGKTSILRAFNLLATNRPQGSRYFNNQTSVEEPCIIEVVLDTGQKITVTKTMEKKKGKVVLKSTFFEMDGEEWKGSREVPDTIKAVLNLGELNFQSQLDPPFLVTSSSGEIAKTINRVTHLEEVDEFVYELNKIITARDREYKFKEIEREKTEGNLNNLPDIAKAEKYLKRTETLTNKKQNLTEELNRLLGFLDDLKGCRERLSKAKETSKRISKVEKNISKYENLSEEMETLAEERQLLLGYISIASRNREKLEILKQKKKELAELLSQQKVCPTCEEPLNVKQIIKRSFQ